MRHHTAAAQNRFRFADIVAPPGKLSMVDLARRYLRRSVRLDECVSFQYHRHGHDDYRHFNRLDERRSDYRLFRSARLGEKTCRHAPNLRHHHHDNRRCRHKTVLNKNPDEKERLSPLFFYRLKLISSFQKCRIQSVRRLLPYTCLLPIRAGDLSLCPKR